MYSTRTSRFSRRQGGPHLRSFIEVADPLACRRSLSFHLHSRSSVSLASVHPQQHGAAATPTPQVASAPVGTPDTEMNQLLECPLCMNPFVMAMTVQCGHSFCDECIHKWRLQEKRSTCPTCRMEITTDPFRAYTSVLAIPNYFCFRESTQCHFLM
jgi:hypothetical protein